MKKSRVIEYTSFYIYEDGLLWKIKNKNGPAPDVLSGAYTGIKDAMKAIDKYFLDKEYKVKTQKDRYIHDNQRKMMKEESA